MVAKVGLRGDAHEVSSVSPNIQAVERMMMGLPAAGIGRFTDQVSMDFGRQAGGHARGGNIELQ